MIERFETFICHCLFSEFVPKVFDRIELGTVRGLGYESYVLRDFEALGHMPTCLVNDHDNEEVFEILGNVIEK